MDPGKDRNAADKLEHDRNNDFRAEIYQHSDDRIVRQEEKDGGDGQAGCGADDIDHRPQKQVQHFNGQQTDAEHRFQNDQKQSLNEINVHEDQKHAQKFGEYHLSLDIPLPIAFTKDMDLKSSV